MPGALLRHSMPPARQGQGSHCHVCRKLIVWPGLCYTCATGRPRLIVRRDERARLDAPQPLFPADGVPGAGSP